MQLNVNEKDARLGVCMSEVVLSKFRSADYQSMSCLNLV